MSYKLTLNNYGKIVVGTDNGASYTVSDIHLEFKMITSPEIVNALRVKYYGKRTALYDRVILFQKAYGFEFPVPIFV